MISFGSRTTILLAALAMAAAPSAAQVRTVDPNTAIDADVTPPPGQASIPYDQTLPAEAPQPAAPATDPAAAPYASPAYGTPAPAPASTTYKQDDLIGAAEGVFGKGAKGLADLIEKILKDQGEPNAYIAGREAGGALVAGLRYGSGTLFHKIEGQRPAYWTGPSIGFDAGGNAGKTFILVYNLYDSQDLYKRFPAGEGNAYFIGGFTASYMRHGDIVLIPIRVGVGYRLGANVGYMKFSEKQRWLPF
ncbi:DUF1134 domain-containing protein [Sphingomonas flavalba]|uniref:DUF1134 domain-containing protein n=1 Tax=Sphingomonas flavalba TaxID=2559804 RepID=UPI0039E1AE71